jgi:hypothetical protein
MTDLKGLLASNLVQVGTESDTGMDIGGGEEEVTTSGITLDSIGQYIVVCRITTALTSGAAITNRCVTNDGSNDYEEFNDKVTISANAIRSRKSTNVITVDVAGLVLTYFLTSDQAGDNSVNATVTVYKIV